MQRDGPDEGTAGRGPIPVCVCLLQWAPPRKATALGTLLPLGRWAQGAPQTRGPDTLYWKWITK